MVDEGSEPTPTIDCVFAEAKKRATYGVMLYTNADIVFFDDLAPTLTTVARHTPMNNFFVVGGRRDLEFPTTFDEGSLGRMVADKVSWGAELQQRAAHESKGHPREGVDWMAFPTSRTPVLPPFLVGRVQWDNWALLNAIVDPNIVSFEVSDVVLAVHLNHGVSKASHKRAGTKHNQQLAVYLPHPWVNETKVHHPGVRNVSPVLAVVPLLRQFHHLSYSLPPPHTHTHTLFRLLFFSSCQTSMHAHDWANFN